MAIFVQFRKLIRSLNARPSCPRAGNMSVTKCLRAKSTPRSATVRSSGTLTDSQMDTMWLARRLSDGPNMTCTPLSNKRQTIEKHTKYDCCNIKSFDISFSWRNQYIIYLVNLYINEYCKKKVWIIWLVVVCNVSPSPSLIILNWLQSTPIFRKWFAN